MEDDGRSGVDADLWRNIVQAGQSPICAFDTEFRLTAFNQAHSDEFYRIYAYRVKVGDVFPDLFHPEQAPVMRALMARALSGESFSVVEEFGDPDIIRPYWEIIYTPLRNGRGEIIGAFHHAQDITARLRAQSELAVAQEALRQSQKLEAVGQLTGGVAHDFNNLLTPIMGTLDMLQHREVIGDRELTLIETALRASERATTLVQRLLAFARRQPLRVSAVDVPQLVVSLADLIRRTLGPQITVEVDPGENVPCAEADPNQLEMAILNLSVNARDAMADGGTLTLAASAEEISAGHKSHLQPGRYVRLTVTDTGMGMSPETLARAIEPFYTTKGVGRGTGLGLSMVHGLAAQLGGGLAIDSAPGKGTRIDLWLRESREIVEPVASSREIAPVAKATGRVLLVDDEDIVRQSTADILAELGYDVIEARSAARALDILSRNEQVDLLLTDHLMPGMSGAELAEAAQMRWPELPVLLISGYAEVAEIAPGFHRLAKPFRVAELAEGIAMAQMAKR